MQQPETLDASASPLPKPPLMERFLNWVKEHPGTVLVVVGIVALVALVVYWIVDNWPIIKALGTAALIAASVTFLAFIIAGIVGVAAPAMIAAVRALRAKLGLNKDAEEEAKAAADKLTDATAKADAIKAAEDAKAAADADGVDMAQTLQTNVNQLSQDTAGGNPGTLSVTYSDGTSSTFSDPKDAESDISTQSEAGNPPVVTTYDGAA